MLIQIILQGFAKSGSTILLMVAILVPMMIIFEYARYYHLLEKISPYFNWLTRCLTLSSAAAFPLVIGLFFGLVYGAAVLIEFSRQKLISRRDMILLGIFLALNHSIVEDNLLFTALGANFLMLFCSRFALAFLFTRAAALWLDSKEKSKSGTAAAGDS